MQDQEKLPLIPRLDTGLVPKEGFGSAIAHHGEIIQGQIEQPDGSLWRGLVSLSCGIFRSEATYYPEPDTVVHVVPSWKEKARAAVKIALANTHAKTWGGRLQINSNVPLRWGFGSSTSDVTASIRAVSDAFCLNFSSEEIGVIAVKAETASDPIMFGDRAVLFAHREGIVIEDFGRLPPFDVVGFNTDPTGHGISTLDFGVASYTHREIDGFSQLVNSLREALENCDYQRIGNIASDSARINQRFLPKPHFDQLEKIVERVDALGLQAAHTGTVMGLLFKPNDPEMHERERCARALLAEVGIDNVWRFRSGNS